MPIWTFLSLIHSSQDCSKGDGDKVQRFLLAAIRSVLHPHLDKEPAHCLPPGQGEAWEGICTAGSPHETNPPPASGKAGRWGGGRGRKEWRQPCPPWRSPPVTEIFEIQQRCLSGCCSSCEAENILWSLFDSPIAAVGTLVFSFFGAALRQFSSVSFSIREAVSETGGDGFFLNLTYFFKFWGLLRWDTIDNVHCIYTVPFTEQLLNAPFSSLTHQMYIHTSYISKGFSGQWINSSFVLFCSGGESRSFHW